MFQGADQALAWNIGGSITVAFLLTAFVWSRWSKLTAAVWAWWMFEEFLVSFCSAWRIFDWWPVEQGQAQCSARLDVNLGAISGVAIVLLAAYIYKRTSHE